MTKNDLRNTLLKTLAPDLAAYGYTLNKNQATFTKKMLDGWQKFGLIFLDYDGWEINPYMLIRKDIVEEIYHQASYFDIKFHKTTPTIGISLEDFINNKQSYRFRLMEQSDIEPCRQWIVQAFTQLAEPFFTKYYSLEELDKAVNILNGKSIFSGPKYEGNVGLILAKLVKNPDYNIFVRKYRHYYEWLSDGFYLPEYEKLIQILGSF